MSARPGERLYLRAMAAAVRTGEETSAELVRKAVERAEETADLNAFITLDRDGARAAAEKADAALAAGKQTGPLHGVPIVVKDNINVAGLPMTNGTLSLKDFIPAETAPVVQPLLEAGAIVLGKTNMHEMAFGASSINAAFGSVGNAYAADRFAGGSSGGTGAAVAAGVAAAGLGSDTGGSVRIPSALNGIAGLRPSVGRYAQQGICPISHTRDTAGPMAQSVADLVLLDDLITAAGDEVRPADLCRLRFGIAHPFADSLSEGTAACFAASLAAIQRAGAGLVEVDLSEVVEISPAMALPIALYEVRRDLAAFLDRAGTGLTLQDVAGAIVSADVKEIFETFILGPEAITESAYQTAMRELRPKVQAIYQAVFRDERLDALVFPTVPIEAQPIASSAKTLMLRGHAVPTFTTLIRNTDPNSCAGLPGLTVPGGASEEGLPVGLALDGLAGSDRRLLSIGLALEALFQQEL